jgi:DNA polymerase-3 subunit delta'
MKVNGFIGNDRVVSFLSHAISDQVLSHAYLFVGPGNVGKATLAETFAKVVMCKQSDKITNLDACGMCVSCQQMEKVVHSDYHVLRKSDDQKNISVADLRGFQNSFYKTPLLGKKKVGIIDTADDLNVEGANALLKTLEEPPGESIIILISNNIDLLPPTVISRCQVIQFSLVTKMLIKNMLFELGCDRSKSDTISSIAMGKPGVAIKYFQNNYVYEKYIEDIRELVAIYNSGIPEKFSYIQKYLESRKYQEKVDKARELMAHIDSVIHDCILIKNYLGKQIINSSMLDTLSQLSAKYSFTELTRQQKMLSAIRNKFSNSINPQLALENYFLKTRSNA